MGRNPATGEAIKIKASRKVAVRPAKELKEARDACGSWLRAASVKHLTPRTKRGGHASNFDQNGVCQPAHHRSSQRSRVQEQGWTYGLRWYEAFHTAEPFVTTSLRCIQGTRG
jgi:Bacterial DNA-binding protein